MLPFDLDVRNATYARFADLGRPPSLVEVAAAVDAPAAEIHTSWNRLHVDHAIVLDADGELLMAHPFSAVPTAFRVTADGREWDANCAWDAIGICAALGCDGRVRTTCADCGEAIEFSVVDTSPSDPTLVFHCLVPASRWWDDIAFT